MPKNEPYLICDIDGVIAIAGDRCAYDWERSIADSSSTAICDFLRIQQLAGLKIILLTGRSDQWRSVTLQWLEKNQVPYDDIFFRSAGDERRGWEIKEDLFYLAIQSQHGEAVRFVLDDDLLTCQMFMRNGVLALHILAEQFPSSITLNTRKNRFMGPFF